MLPWLAALLAVPTLCDGGRSSGSSSVRKQRQQQLQRSPAAAGATGAAPSRAEKTNRFANALGGANSHDRLAHLLQILTVDPAIDVPSLQVPYGAQGAVSALVHVAKVHIFMRSSVNRTLAEAAGHNLDVVLNLAEVLLVRGADANVADPHCLTPLHYAVWARDAALTRLLLRHGARCDAGMGLLSGWTPLHLAVDADPRSTFTQLAQLRAAQERGEWVDAIKEVGGMENTPVTSLGGPPLRRGTAESLRINAAHGALFADWLNITLQRGRGVARLGGPADGRAVRAALSEWRQTLLGPLLESGTCDLDALGGLFQTTALHHALTTGNSMPAARALVRAGASLDATDRAGHTPLHYASRVGLIAADQAELIALAEESRQRHHGMRKDAEELEADLLGVKSLAGQVASELGARSPSDRRHQEEQYESIAGDGRDDGDDGGWRSAELPELEEGRSCDLEVMDGKDLTAESFAPYITGHRPLLVRGLAQLAAPRLVREWSRKNFLEQYGGLMFETATVGYASMLGMKTNNTTVAEYMEQTVFRAGVSGEVQESIFANDVSTQAFSHHDANAVFQGHL